MSILRLENMSLKLGLKSILKHISYTVQPGDFVILLGSNGSGKSSLLKVLHRDYHGNKGSVHFLDKSITNYSNEEFSVLVASLTQNSADSLFNSLTIYENYLLVKQHLTAFNVPHQQEHTFLARYLREFNPNLSNKLDQLVAQLSGGEKQALALAFCLLQPPALLLLDEHTSALDPKTSEQIMQLTQKIVAEHHITCILTTHDLDIALRYGNRLLILREGEIHKIVDHQDKSSLTKETLMASYL